MAKLLCIANWPADGKEHPEYPLSFNLELSPNDEANWMDCHSTVELKKTADGEAEVMSAVKGQILQRDIQRLASDLKSMVNQTSSDQLTFVPVTPLFELWLSRLSDDHYRVIVWQDMTGVFEGASEIGYQGIRFTSNR